jgi:hypothetical protein
MRSDELTFGLGDSAVSVRSARLEGVSDFRRIPIVHTEWANVDQPDIRDMVAKVASLVQRQ